MDVSKFSSDLVFEILTRTSLKCLDRCKLVCKDWNKLTYESSFTSLHCERTGTISGYFVQNLRWNKYFAEFVSMNGSNLSLDFLPHPMKIEASSNQGILCCVSEQYRNSRFYVCKPSTRQWQALPNPKMRYFTIKVAIVVLRSNPLRFKIFRLSSPKQKLIKYYNYRCEIFESDTWTWRELKDLLLPVGVIFSNEPAVVASGVIYWLLSNKHVFEFNIGIETYTIFALPPPIISEKNEFYYTDKQLVEFKGRLAFICSEPEGYLVLWVMEEYTNHVWKKRQMVSIEALRDKEPYPSCAAFYNADIALMKGFCSVLFYKLQDCSFSEVKLHRWMNPREVFAFRSDLEPTELRCGV